MPQVKRGRRRIQVGVLVTSFSHQIRQPQPPSAGLLQPGEVKDFSLQTVKHPENTALSSSAWEISTERMKEFPWITRTLWKYQVVSNISPSLFSHSQHNFELRPLHRRIYFLELQVIWIIQSAPCFIFQGIQRRPENPLECHCCKAGLKGAPSTHGN